MARRLYNATIILLILLTAILGGLVLYLALDQPIFYENPVVKKIVPSFLLSAHVGLDNLTPPTEGKAIVANLGEMKLALYENGQKLAELPIVSKGKPGQPWETPAGSYQIITREKNHWSTFGSVWMPYSLQFFGNFFIHGWPYYENGDPVGRGFSGGCIRLETIDAEKVYRFAETGTPVIVIGSSTEDKWSDFGLGYNRRDDAREPQVSAEAYLIADLDTGELIAGRETQTLLPIASIAKLMSAVIAAETLNQFSSTTISASAVAAWGDAGGLHAGEELAIKDLTYPLLLESSNDAAEALLEIAGRKQFVKNMNARARAIGLAHTTFADASGSSADNRSTAEELFKLAQYLYRHKQFVFNITKLKKYQSGEHLWINNNPNVAAEAYLGGKNGQTQAAGQTQVSLFSLPLAEFGERRVAIIVLASRDRDADTAELVKYLKENIFYGNRLPIR